MQNSRRVYRNEWATHTRTGARSATRHSNRQRTLDARLFTSTSAIIASSLHPLTVDNNEKGWTPLRKLIFIALIAVALAACQRGDPQIADPNKISQIQKGSSTKSDIRALFGSPEATYHNADGTQMWIYNYHSIPATSVMFGVYAGGHSYATMSVSFDKSGIVNDYHVSGTTK